MKMSSKIRRLKLIRISIELTALLAVLLGVFTPKMSENAGITYPRLLLSSIMITIATLIILLFQKNLRFPALKNIVLGLIFPLFFTCYEHFGFLREFISDWKFRTKLRGNYVCDLFSLFLCWLDIEVKFSNCNN